MTHDKTLILVINAGSSSLKFQLYDVQENKDLSPSFNILGKGLIERIGIDNSKFTLETNKGDEINYLGANETIPDHAKAAQLVVEALLKHKIIDNFQDIKGIGHRIVHGGEEFKSSTILTEEIMAKLEKTIDLAPLHNPAALNGINAFKRVISHALIVGVFDTAFHSTLPAENFLYSVPYEWYKNYQVRRYGFHGTSYRYILEKIKAITNKPESEINAIVCHLGNGASICAIKDGKCFNTTMGLTPLDGLIMGSRSGIIDPSIHNFINLQSNKKHQEDKTHKPLNLAEITDALNRQSGLLGISGKSSDLRDVIAAVDQKDERAILALKMFITRIANYIIQYANDLGSEIDALVFTAGIGENSSIVRNLVCQEIKLLKIRLNSEKNQEKYGDFLNISEEGSDIQVYKIRTNEEIMICKDTFSFLKF